jgi:hypothetical protein
MLVGTSLHVFPTALNIIPREFLDDAFFLAALVTVAVSTQKEPASSQSPHAA